MDLRLEEFNVLDEDEMTAHFNHIILLEIGEHAVETFARGCGVVRELLIRERYGDQNPLIGPVS